jgi:acetate CoA/acetoacetate CoA-transferase alpha subunit
LSNQVGVVRLFYMVSEPTPRGKLVSLREAVDQNIASGMTLLVGGFGRGGTPFTMLEYLADHADRFDGLTVVKNDGSEPDLGLGPLFQKGMVRKLVSTHIGLNPDVVRRMNEGSIDVELVPQGIFAERIRAAGAGIPAFLTDIGVHTAVAEGHEKIDFKGVSYLVEEALGGDVSLLSADRVDRAGNCWWRGSNRNMNVVMGMAARTVLVEAFDIVDVGIIPPEDVQLPGIYVTSIVRAAARRHMAGTS